MMDTSLQAPNRHIHDRSAIDAMTAKWIAEHGEPRRFEQGACTHLDYLQRRMEGYGYVLTYYAKGYYTLQLAGDKRKPKKLNHTLLFQKIDTILVEHGQQPFKVRART